jgi:hypothetical protein
MAKNWIGPIRSFRLSMILDAPTDIVATCLAGLKRAVSGGYELLHPNFRPDRDLEVLILHPAN